MLRVGGPLVRMAALPPWPTAPLVVLASGHCPGCRGAAPSVGVCGSGPCFGRYTPFRLGSGYADTVWCLWFSSWFGRCSQCVAMGCGPVPGPAVAVLSALHLPFACGAHLCRPSRRSGRCAIGSLCRCVGVLPAVRCTPCLWSLGCMRLVPALGLYCCGCGGRWCRAGACDCSP